MELHEQLKEYAFKENIPVFGVAHTSKLAGAPEGYRPEDVLPGARSVVCIGAPVPAGSYSSGKLPLEIAWRSQNLNYRRLDTFSMQLAEILESHGEQTVPVFGCMPMQINENRDVAGYVNQIRMAEAAGIGIVGRNALLLHPDYGSRLMLGGIVTTADIEPFRVPDMDYPDCPEGCRVCADVCPVNAIKPEMRSIDVMRCLAHTSRTPLMNRWRYAFLRLLRPRSAERLMNLRAYDELTFHTCSRCVSQCPYGKTSSKTPERI